MSKKGLLIVVSGPSGVGKDTILDAFLKAQPPDHNFVLAVSATTRPPREGEVEGKDYHFIDKAKFLQEIEQGKLLEYAEYNGNYYGTLKSEVEKQLNEGKHVILIIETKGAEKVRILNPNAVFVFIMPPSISCLEQRLAERQTEDEQAKQARLKIACEEMKKSNFYNYVFVNDDLGDSVDILSAIVKAAECSPVHSPHILQGVCD